MEGARALCLILSVAKVLATVGGEPDQAGAEGVRRLDNLGSGNILRKLDTLGYGNILRQLDPLDQGNILRRQLDSLGHGNILRQLDTLGEENILRQLDTLGEQNILRNLQQKRGGFDAMSGLTFGKSKKNFDEIGRTGFGRFVKRSFPVKRNFDEIDNAGFRSFGY